MITGVKNFLLEKFWLPIIDESVYYNPYNTVVLALLFGALAIYVIYPAVKKMDVDIDLKFFKGFLPFIILGGLTRVLKDINAVNTILLETPFIYIILFGLGIASLWMSKKLEEIKEIKYHRTLSGLGILYIILLLPFYQVQNLQALLLFALTILAWSVPGFLLVKKFKPGFASFEFLVPVAAHYLDATSTFVALTFGAEEKHVLGRIFIELFGNGGMFLLKTMVIIPVVYYIVKDIEGEEKIFYLFIITLLGLGIATRNILQTVALA